MNVLLDSLAGPVRRRPRVVVAVVVLVTLLAGALSGMATQDAGDFEDFATDTPSAAAADRIDELFATGEDVQLAQLFVVAEDGDVLSPESLAEVQRVIGELSSDPAVRAVATGRPPDAPVVTSYAGPVLAAAQQREVDVSTADDDTIDGLYLDAVGSLPAEQAGQAASLLGGQVDGADATAGSIIVMLDGHADELALQAALDAINAQAGSFDGGLEIYNFDFEQLNEDASATVQDDLAILLGVAFLLIIGILAFVYRSVSDVVISLVGLVMAIMWTMGGSFVLGPDVLGVTGGMTQMSQAIPILLVGLGVDYGIHLTMRAREEQSTGAAPDEATGRAIRAVGAALALATMTTMVGFLTNVANPLPPLQDFGVLAAVGVLCAFVVMTTFVPAVRLLMAQRRERLGKAPVGVADDPEEVGALGRISSSFAPVAVHRPVAVLAVAGVVTLVAGIGSTQLSTEFSQTDFFPEGSRALETIEVVTEAFGGGLDETTRVLVEGDVDSSEGSAAVNAFVAGLADVPDVRTFDGAARAEVEVNDAGDAALVSIQTRAGEDAEALEARISDLAADTLAPAGLDQVATSDQLLINEILDQLQSSQLSGLGITLIASMVILALVFWFRDRAPMLGVLAITSVAFSAIWVLGVMVALGIPFNVMTAMVSALAIGIGVPFGIHVVNRFLEDRTTRPELEDAMHHTLAHTGGALIGSAVTTVAGFGVLMLSVVPPMQQFGMVVSLTIAMALVTSLTVLPAMLTLWDRRRRARGTEPGMGVDDRASASTPEPVGTGS